MNKLMIIALIFCIIAAIVGGYTVITNLPSYKRAASPITTPEGTAERMKQEDAHLKKEEQYLKDTNNKRMAERSIDNSAGEKMASESYSYTPPTPSTGTHNGVGPPSPGSLMTCQELVDSLREDLSLERKRSRTKDSIIKNQDTIIELYKAGENAARGAGIEWEKILAGGASGISAMGGMVSIILVLRKERKRRKTVSRSTDRAGGQNV